MPSAQKIKLRKDLEELRPAIKNFTRDDFVLGRWFPTFLDRTLGAMANPPTPPEVQARFPDSTEAADLADEVINATIHEAIVATDAYQENLTGTEIKNLKEKKPGGEQKLTGDTVALLCELFYAMRLLVNVVFQVGAVHKKQVNAGDTPMFEEIFGRALGAFDYEKARNEGKALEQIGVKIFDRAIVQTVGSSLADAQRKGFYCYYAKAIAKETERHMEKLPAWEAPKARGPETGAMMAASPDDPGPAY